MDALTELLDGIPPAGNPPLHLWQPEFSGDIDIRIADDGTWFHEGGAIKRQALTNLFASILRYESSLGFVLVNPVEKWRIQVEDVPFMAIGVQRRQADYWFGINIGVALKLSQNNPIIMRDFKGVSVPYIEVRENILARLSRPVYYELAEVLIEKDGVLGLVSDDCFFAFE